MRVCVSLSKYILPTFVAFTYDDDDDDDNNNNNNLLQFVCHPVAVE